SRHEALSSRIAFSTRSAVRMSAKGRPSTWANWVRRVSIWRVRRRAVEWGTEDLLVWSGWMHPYSQTKEVFVSMPFHGLLLQLQEVPFFSDTFSSLFSSLGNGEGADRWGAARGGGRVRATSFRGAGTHLYSTRPGLAHLQTVGIDGQIRWRPRA